MADRQEFASNSQRVRGSDEELLTIARVVGVVPTMGEIGSEEPASSAVTPDPVPLFVLVPDEAPVEQPHLPLAPSRLRRSARIGLAVVTAALTTGTVAATAVASGLVGGEGACTDNTHQQVNDRQWSTIANGLTTDRGYAVSAGELAAANTQAADVAAHTQVQLKTVAADGTVSDNLAAEGTFCFVIPPPVVAGQVLTNGKESVADVALATAEFQEGIRELNPTLVPPTDTEPVKKDTRLWLDKFVNQQLVLRPMTETDIHTITNGNGTMFRVILLANLNTLDGEVGQVDGFQPGRSYYLPYSESNVSDALKNQGVTASGIQKAYEGSYDYARRNERPTAALTPEAGGHVTAEQHKRIDAMNLDPAQKKFVHDMTDAIAQLRDMFVAKGIRPDVALAQAILESGFGKSDKAQPPYFNFFGMKAAPGDGWTGRVTPPLPTSGGAAIFRAYDSVWQCVKGMIENVRSKNWYGDMDTRKFGNDLGIYLDGMLNQLGPDGRIEIPGKLGWTDDAGYKGKILSLISRYGLTGLFDFNVASLSPPAETPPPPATAEAGVWAPGNIKLDPSKYKDTHQADLWVNPNSNAYMMIDGQKILLKDIEPKLRLKLIEKAMSGVRLSAAGYADFEKRFQDISAQVKADPRLTNFNGEKNGLGTPDVLKDIKYWVWHYTATSNQANENDGLTAAASMQNGGKHVGSWGYINTKGGVYQLTHDRVVNTYGYNDVALGVEIAAGGSETITTEQYQDAIYMTIHFLITHGFVQKGVPVASIVNKMVRGHGELNADMEGPKHTDNVALIMDQIEPMILGGFGQLGYTV